MLKIRELDRINEEQTTAEIERCIISRAFLIPLSPPVTKSKEGSLIWSFNSCRTVALRKKIVDRPEKQLLIMEYINKQHVTVGYTTMYDTNAG